MMIKNRIIKNNWVYLRVILGEHCNDCCFSASNSSGVCTLGVAARHELRFCLQYVLENEKEIADSGVSKNYMYQLTKL